MMNRAAFLEEYVADGPLDHVVRDLVETRWSEVDEDGLDRLRIHAVRLA